MCCSPSWSVLNKTLFDVSSTLGVGKLGIIVFLFRLATLSRRDLSHTDRRGAVVLQLSQAQYSVLSLGSVLVLQLYSRFAEEANSMVQVGIQVLEQEVKSKLEEVCTLHW
jgi:hypothetical protein